MHTTPPIGLSGFAKSGKTTAATYLEERYGYTRMHIADPLRDMLRSLLLDFGMTGADIHEYLEGSKKEQVIPCLGVTSRHAQISLGTAWGREQISPDLWVDCWEKRAARPGKPAMNDSVRFPNEEQVIRKMNGFTIMIVRKGTSPAAFTSVIGRWLYRKFGFMFGVHPSERTDKLSPDFIIENDNSIDIFYSLLDRAITLARSEKHIGQNQPIVLRSPFT